MLHDVYTRHYGEFSFDISSHLGRVSPTINAHLQYCAHLCFCCYSLLSRLIPWYHPCRLHRSVSSESECWSSMLSRDFGWVKHRPAFLHLRTPEIVLVTLHALRDEVNLELSRVRSYCQIWRDFTTPVQYTMWTDKLARWPTDGRIEFYWCRLHGLMHLAHGTAMHALRHTTASSIMIGRFKRRTRSATPLWKGNSVNIIPPLSQICSFVCYRSHRMVSSQFNPASTILSSAMPTGSK